MMQPGLVKAALSLLESLIRPLMLVLGLWKAKQAGREEAEREQAEEELDAVDDARAADAAVSDQRTRDELQRWREER